MFNRICILSCFFLLLLYFKAFGYKNYTTSNGLISNTVYNVYSDKNGYLWFGTDNGCSRFNGKDFKNYTLLDGVSDNSVLNFYEDKLDRLWLFTYNGSHCYIRHDSVFNATNDAMLKKLPVVSFVRSMCMTADSALYMGYNYGTVFKIKGTEGKILIKNDSNYNYISALFYSKPYLNVVAGDKFVTIKDDSVINEKLKVNHCTAFAYEDCILLTDDTGIKMLHDTQLIWSCPHTAITRNNIIKLYPDSKGNIFCCTRNGLVILNYKNNSKTVLLQGLSISGICEDIYGNYWITSLGQGVFCFKKDFTDIQFIDDVKDSKIFHPKNGQIFLAKKNSIYEFKDGHIVLLNLLFNKNYVPLCTTDDYFVFNKSAATYVYDRRLKKETSLYPGSYKSCFAIAKNRFFLNAGYDCVDLTINKAVITMDSFHISLKEKILDLVFQENNKCFYFLTGTKLYEYKLLSHSLNIIDSFSSQKTPVALYGFNNSIVVSTNANYCILYATTKNAKKIGNFGFHNRVFFDLIDIGNNTYIAYTNNGYYLLKVSANNLMRSSFRKIEYPFNESEIAAIHSSGNSILCDANGSLYTFNKDLINNQISKPQIFIDKITANGVVIKDNAVIKNTLSCNIGFSLSSLYYNNTDIKYKYRIKTADNATQWFTSNVGEFNMLLPGYGSYDIEIKAITENDMVSPPKFLHILWVAPFYFTWWFKCLAVIAVISAGCYGLYEYYKKKNKAFQNELKYLQLEYKAINSLINPHFIFNAINNIQNLVNQHASEEANEYLAMLSRLIRQNIENLQFNLIPLEKELNLIRNYIHLQNLRFTGKISLVINDNVAHSEIYIPPLLIQTFVENAIVHGFSSQADNFKISVDLSTTTEDYLTICITDNGVGLKQSSTREKSIKDKTSLGIDITRKRIERLSDFYKVDYSLDIVDMQDTGENGTKVFIRIYSKFSELMFDSSS